MLTSCILVLGQVWYLSVSIPDICLLPYFKMDNPRRCCFLDPFCSLCFLFVFHTVLSVSCIYVAIRWKRTDLLTLWYMVFSSAFVTLPFGVLGQVWYLIVSIPDLGLLLYFQNG